MSAYYGSDGTRYPRSWQVVINHGDGTIERLEKTENKSHAEAHADALAARFERQGLTWMVGVEEVRIFA